MQPVTTPNARDAFLFHVSQQRTVDGPVEFSYPLVEAWKRANADAGVTLNFYGQPAKGTLRVN